MKILFLGYVVTADEANELSGASVAGNTMQLELIREMELMPDVEIDVCSLLPLATFPKEPRGRIRASQRDIGPGIGSYRPGFLTLPGLKQSSQIMSMTRAASRLAKHQNYDYVLAFNMLPLVGVAAWWMKKRHGVPVACLLADPPVVTTDNNSWLASAALRAYNWWTRRLLGVVDRVISLTPDAARAFVPQARALTLDGAVPARLAANTPARSASTDEKAILFTGALTPYNGIAEMVQAMRLVKDPSVVLHVYGGGPLSEFVRESVQACSNIVFHGKVDSSDIPSLQRDAFLLLNPRQIDHPVSDVTFPSKVLEYMASGTPVLTTRLRSFSSDYEGLVYFAEEGSPRDLAMRIDTLCALPPEELARVGAAARRFILETRTWNATAERVRRFLSAT